MPSYVVDVVLGGLECSHGLLAFWVPELDGPVEGTCQDEAVEEVEL